MPKIANKVVERIWVRVRDNFAEKNLLGAARRDATKSETTSEV